MFFTKLCVTHCVLFLSFNLIQCDFQIGPDPWDVEVNDKLNQVQGDIDIPPDLRARPERKINTGNGAGSSEWFYKRMLAIILKAGQVKKNEDGTVAVSLQMKFENDRWQLLEGYTSLNVALTEDMIRRSIGFLEEAIYKPTIIDKVAVAWTQYVQLYLVEYKMHITWTLGILAVLTAAMWMRKYISLAHIYLVLFILLYLYEAFTSYKKVEKEDLQRFVSAVNSCKWYFWSSHCDVPPPDPLIFIKHMNPIKIVIRMFTNVITEPMICINEAAKELIHGITDSLVFPLNKIVYGFLVLNFTILVILFLIMIVFNYILNIPFNFSFLGLFNIGLRQRNRTFNTNGPDASGNGGVDRISGDTLNRLLDVCSRALSTAEITQNSQNRNNTILSLTNAPTTCRLRRSASTGRLPNNSDNFTNLQNENPRKLNKKSKFNGGGDGFL